MPRRCAASASASTGRRSHARRSPGRCAGEERPRPAGVALRRHSTDSVVRRGGLGGWRIVDYRLEAEELISRTLAELDVDAVGKAIVGGPVETLVELTHRVDLLVVGSRGWGPIRRILLGSTAARLIREAACPVLVLPRGAATGEPGEHEPATVEIVPRTAA